MAESKQLSLLPTGPNDGAGKAHLLVEKEDGTSNLGTGLPGTYPGAFTTIDPADSNIVYNTALARWEVTFDVTSFSGFFIKTSTTVLPLTLINFSGNRQGTYNALQWITANEVDTKMFTVESSADATSFAPIGQVAATGGGHYGFTDIDPKPNRTYYRLKMVDIDGKFTYSNIISINGSDAKDEITFYPNPVIQTAVLNIGNNNQLMNTQATMTDAGGRTIRLITIKQNKQEVDMATFPTGLYFLKLQDGSAIKIMKR